MATIRKTVKTLGQGGYPFLEKKETREAKDSPRKNEATAEDETSQVEFG